MKQPSKPMTEHGITTSDADYWVHVSPRNRCVYWYRRESMLKLIGVMPDSATREIASAFGYVVPVNDPCVRGSRWDCGDGWDGTDQDVGAAAERVFRSWVCESGVLRAMCGSPIAILDVRYAATKEEQLRHDFVVRVASDIRVEVKADITAASTGRIFVQTHERNHQWSKRRAHNEMAHP